MKQGLLIVLSGPSGVGKGTLVRYLKKDSEFKALYSISETTRPRRLKEVNGRDYYFVSPFFFQNGIKDNRYIEYASYCGNYYGTPKDFVIENLNAGNSVLLEIETNGAKQVMDKFRGMYVLTIFLMPPSIEELEKRIRARDSETEQQIEARINLAKEEMKLKDNYDVVLTNYTVNKTIKRFKQAVNNRINYIEAVENGQEVSPNYIIKRP